MVEGQSRIRTASDRHKPTGGQREGPYLQADLWGEPREQMLPRSALAGAQYLPLLKPQQLIKDLRSCHQHAHQLLLRGRNEFPAPVVAPLPIVWITMHKARFTSSREVVRRF